MRCSSPGVPIFGPAGPVVVNVVTADLSRPGLRLVPVTAPASASLATLDVMAQDDGRKGLLAGINGGYFWRVDDATFLDSVCQGKTLADAKMPASPASLDAGVGDAVTVAGGVYLSSNCNLTGFNRPAVLTINGTATRVDLLGRGAPPPAGLALDALGAGPYLLHTNASGTFVSIPSDDENW